MQTLTFSLASLLVLALLFSHGEAQSAGQLFEPPSESTPQASRDFFQTDPAARNATPRNVAENPTSAPQSFARDPAPPSDGFAREVNQGQLAPSNVADAFSHRIDIASPTRNPAAADFAPSIGAPNARTARRVSGSKISIYCNGFEVRSGSPEGQRTNKYRLQIAGEFYLTSSGGTMISGDAIMIADDVVSIQNAQVQTGEFQLKTEKLQFEFPISQINVSEQPRTVARY